MRNRSASRCNPKQNEQLSEESDTAEPQPTKHARLKGLKTKKLKAEKNSWPNGKRTRNVGGEAQGERDDEEPQDERKDEEEAQNDVSVVPAYRSYSRLRDDEPP